MTNTKMPEYTIDQYDQTSEPYVRFFDEKDERAIFGWEAIASFMFQEVMRLQGESTKDDTKVTRTESDFEAKAKSLLALLYEQGVTDGEISIKHRKAMNLGKALSSILHLHQQETLKVIGDDDAYGDGQGPHSSSEIVNISINQVRLYMNNLRAEQRTNLSNREDTK